MPSPTICTSMWRARGKNSLGIEVAVAERGLAPRSGSARRRSSSSARCARRACRARRRRPPPSASPRRRAELRQERRGACRAIAGPACRRSIGTSQRSRQRAGRAPCRRTAPASRASARRRSGRPRRRRARRRRSRSGSRSPGWTASQPASLRRGDDLRDVEIGRRARALQRHAPRRPCACAARRRRPRRRPRPWRCPSRRPCARCGWRSRRDWRSAHRSSVVPVISGSGSCVRLLPGTARSRTARPRSSSPSGPGFLLRFEPLPTQVHCWMRERSLLADHRLAINRGDDLIVHQHQGSAKYHRGPLLPFRRT